MTTHASVLARAQHALAEFFRLEAAGGIVLIAAAVLAMLAANSPLAHAYEVFRDTPLGAAPGAKSLHWWINDGLMAVFFLLVSLEIKREVISGQLSSRDQLVLPVVCAVAGVAVPALLYTAMNHGDAGAMRGWAIPTATDIAFALGVLALLGSRVPLGMKLLLSTIAVADDLIAILIIAFFYSQGLQWGALAGAAVVVLAMSMLNRRKVTRLAPYLLLGVVLWVLRAGVRRARHAGGRGDRADDPALRPRQRDRRRQRTFAAGNPGARAASVGGVRHPAAVRIRQCRAGAGRIAPAGPGLAAARGDRAGAGAGQAGRHRAGSGGDARAGAGAGSRRAWTCVRCWASGCCAGSASP